MAGGKVLIREFLEKSAAGLLIDVRSPSEYNHAHIPGAVNLPLFSDEERKIVGTAYKQESRQKAIKIGLDFLGPKMRPMVEAVENLMAERFSKGPHQPSVFVYCWRGGMRSAAVAWLLQLYGFEVYTLTGGYKAFRNWVLQSFTENYPLKIVGGYTGSGKTEVLQELALRGEIVIDLEKLASHKGSAFGNINMPPQPTQEMFENLLGCVLKAACCRLAQSQTISSGTDNNPSFHNPNCIWLEDESQRIGDLNLPQSFWQTMRQAPVYFLELPFEERLRHITEEYGNLNPQRLASGIERISKRLGGLETKTALQHLQAGHIKDCFRILLQYYDKRYLKGLHNRENPDALLHVIACSTVSNSNAALLLKAAYALPAQQHQTLPV